jgi:hypothetical protein
MVKEDVSCPVGVVICCDGVGAKDSVELTLGSAVAPVLEEINVAMWSIIDIVIGCKIVSCAVCPIECGQITIVVIRAVNVDKD